jgi:putative DNA primase/helicase
MILDLRQIARVLGGEITGKQALCPGPGHSPRDRSLSITLSSTAPDGFALFSHCGDDWRDCRDHVKRKLGLPLGPSPREATGPRATAREPVRGQDDRAQGATTTADAMALWRGSVDGRGTPIERYLNLERKLDIDPYLAVAVLRWHPGAGAMLALFRNILTRAIQAVERIFLDQDAKKIGRKFLGPAKGAAAMLDPFENVLEGLHVGAGVENRDDRPRAERLQARLGARFRRRHREIPRSPRRRGDNAYPGERRQQHSGLRGVRPGLGRRRPRCLHRRAEGGL